MARKARTVHKVSIRLIAKACSISETCYLYEAKLYDENAEIADWLLRLMQTYRRLGFGLCFANLRT
jgi:putative transposase